MIKRILVVDDSAYMRIRIRKILVTAGYMVSGEAENGYEACEIYRQQQPDLLVMNLMMPQMDGLEALREIKAWDPNAKILICSAMGQTQQIFALLRAGANNFLSKPFQEEQLIQAVKKTLTPQGEPVPSEPSSS